MFNLVYLLLEQKLKSLVATDQTTLLRHVDRYRAQYELNQTDKQLPSVPACLIEFNQADLRSNKGGAQLIQMPITLHIVTMASSSQQQMVSAAVHKNQSHEDLVEQIYLALQGSRAAAKDLAALASLPDTDNFQVYNTLNRTGYEQSLDYLPLLVTQLSFETLAFDPAAVPKYQVVQATLKASATKL